MAHAYGPDFPRGTILVNLTGSFLIALVMELSLSTGALPENARLFLTTGVLGGYTTYSSFNHDTLRMGSEGAYGLAALNVGITVAGALLAGLGGLVVARLIARAGGFPG
jgi:CrcB protein